MPRPSTIGWLILVLAVAVFETACGPVRSTMGVVDATKALKEAEAEGAESHAPYEMNLAREYLRKAHEEMGYNDYYMAEQLAQKAAELADLALDKALGSSLIEAYDVDVVEPDLDVIPEEGELDPDRRRGDEAEGEDLLPDLDTEEPEESEEPTPAEPESSDNPWGTP